MVIKKVGLKKSGIKKVPRKKKVKDLKNGLLIFRACPKVKLQHFFYILSFADLELDVVKIEQRL